MANKPLKTIKFPGLDDTYTVPQIDTTLAVSGKAADAKKVGDELTNLKQDYNSLSESKADKTVNNPSMGSGYASQLVSSLRKSDSVPYNFRKVPYDATLEDGNIVGASVAWNQLINPDEYGAVTSYDTWTKTGSKVTANGTPSSNAVYKFSDQSRMVTGHKYYLKGCPQNGASDKWYIRVTGSNNYYDYGSGIVFSYGNAPSSSEYVRAYVTSGTTVNNIVFEPMLFDLTAMLGTTIANYVYSLETATAGSGVAWLKEHFQKQFGGGYQAYNAGEIKSISGLSAHKSVGFNQWDEVWEPGVYNSSGQPVSYPSDIRSKNYIEIVPGQTYRFTAPKALYVTYYDADYNCLGETGITNATRIFGERVKYIRFCTGSYGGTYNHDICINISKATGTPKNGDYVPYEEHSYALDSTKTFRGILKLDSNNKLYADGDRYLADGTVQRRYGVVDLGTLDWVYVSSGSVFAPYFYAPIPNMKQPTNIQTAAFDIICDKYVTTPRAQGTFVSGCICADVSGSTQQIQIIDTTYTGSSAFKTAMSGVKLIYPLATPTTETAEPYGNPQVINPDGTESYVYTDGAFELPVGHESEYPVNVSGQLDDILDTPTTNGTYTLQATVTDGAVSYEWVSA